MARLLKVRTKTVHDGQVRTMSIGPRSGRVFASGGEDQMIYLWTITEEAPLLTFGPFSSAITCCAFFGTEDFLVFGTENGLVSILDLDNDKTSCSWQIDDDYITCVNFHPQTSEIVVAGCQSGQVYIFSTEQRYPIQSYSAHTGTVNNVRICPAGTILATTGEDKVIRIFDLTTGNMQGTIRPSCKCPFLNIDFHPTEKIIAGCTEDRNVRIFDIDRMTELKGSFVVGSEPPNQICFSQDGEVVGSCSPAAISLFKTESADHMDHLQISLGETHDMIVFNMGIAVASSFESNVTVFLVSTDDFKLIKKKKKKKKKKPVDPRPVVKLAQDLQPPAVQQPMLPRYVQPPTPPPGNEALFKRFREDRAEYLAILAQRLARYGRLKDAIRLHGLSAALTQVATSGDSANEMIILLQDIPEALTLDNSVDIVNILHFSLQIDEELSVHMLQKILRKHGLIIQEAVDNVRHPYKEVAENIRTALHGLTPLLIQIIESGSPGGMLLKIILKDWKRLF